MPASCVLVVQI